MRVLQITPSLFCPSSGLAVVVAETAGGLRAAGVDVTVASVGEPAGERERAAFPCLVAARSRLPGLAGWHYSRHLRPLIEAAFATPPDVVHAQGLWLYPQDLARSLSSRWQRPLVVTPHGMLEPWARRHHAWRKRVCWWLSTYRTLSAARAVVATSEPEADHLRAAGVRCPVVVIPPGVRIPGRVTGGERAEVRGQRAEVRGQRAEGEGRRVALFLSRVHPSKGLRLLVDAVARLRPPGWRFVIAGPDEHGHVADLQRRVRRAGLENGFAFVGPVQDDEKWRLYQSADLFVLPSYSENFALVVAEALAAGLPVVTTTGTPWRDLSQRGCGWVCETSGDALTRTLSEALTCSDARRRQMGAAGSAWVRQAFTPEENARQHVELYRRISSDVAP